MSLIRRDLEPFDTRIHPLYTPLMATKRPIGQIAPAVWNPVGVATVPKAFRITQDHANKLSQEPYANNASVLVRMLLKEYFENRVPSVKFQFQKLLNQCIEE